MVFGFVQINGVSHSYSVFHNCRVGGASETSDVHGFRPLAILMVCMDVHKNYFTVIYYKQYEKIISITDSSWSEVAE